MLDKAQLLGLTAPEMTVLIGGMRSLGISFDGTGILTDNPNILSNDHFEKLLDSDNEWSPVEMALINLLQGLLVSLILRQVKSI